MADTTPVSIRIEVTDANSAAVVGTVTQNMQQLGVAGVNAGRQVAQGMGTGAAGIRAMSTEMAAMQARQQAVINQLNAWKPQDRTPLGMFNAQVTAFSKQGMNGLAAQEAAIAAVSKTMRDQEAAAAAAAATTKGMAGAYGEARIAMGALTGNTRQMEMGLANVGARLKWMAPLWAGAMDATIAIAGVAIVAQMAEGVYNLYEKWFDVDRSVKEYSAELDKARNKDFGNTRSIETTTLRINEATAALRNYEAQVAGHQTAGNIAYSLGNPIEALHQEAWAKAAQDNATDMQRQIDELNRERLPEQQHERNLQQIEAVHSADDLLQGYRKITAELQKQLDIGRENARYSAQEEGAFGNPVGVPSLWSTGHVSSEANQDYIDQQHAAAERANLARQTDSEIRRIHEQAVEADLKGVDLLEQQRKFADEDFVRTHGQNADALLDIDHKYYAEEKKLLDQQASERAQKAQEAAQQAAQESEAYLESLNQFANRVDRMLAENATRGKSGFARIHADAQMQISDLTGGAPAGSGYDQARAERGIRSAEAQQVSALQQKNAEETAQIEAQARAKYLSAEKQQTVAIQTEYEQRLSKFQAELDAQQIGEDDYNRRAVAAAQMRDAELVNSARQARERMAGEFTGLFRGFDHPLRELQEMGEKVGGQAAAALVQRVQNRHGGSGTGGSGFDITNPFGGIYDKLAGVPRGVGERPESAASVLAQAHSIAVSQAAIQVGSANISVGGGGASVGVAGARGAAGAPGAAGVSYRSGGSTNAGAVPVSSGGTGSASWGSGAGYGGGNFDVSQMATAVPGSSASSAGGWSSTGAAGVSMGHPGSAQPIAPRQSNVAGSVVGDLSSGMSLYKQATGIFGARGSAGSLSHDDSTDTIDTDSGITGLSNGGMLRGGGFGANALGAAGGAIGVYGAYEGNGGVGGALSGGMSGMQLGMALGGPIGAGIGAVGGAVLGAIGMGGREKARVYDLKQVRPQMAAELQSYQTGATDYLTAYSDMQTLDTTAERTTKQWGPAAHSYYDDTIRTEIAQARGKFDQMEKAGRSNFGLSAAQYSTGTDSVPAMLTPGERVIPSDQNERITRAIESGASSQRRPVQSPGGWGGDIHIHALDAATASEWIMNNKHTFRAAVNASYAENSGGADAGF